MKTRIAVGLIVLALAAVSSACSGSDADSGGISVKEVNKLASDASDYQQEILKDGKVTYPEYEKAMNAERDCMIEKGYKPNELNLDRGMLVYSINIEDDNPDVVADLDSRLTAEQTACGEEYSSVVSWVWGQQDVPSDSEREEMKPKVYDCLRQAGLEIKDTASDDELAEILLEVDQTDQKLNGAIDACSSEYYQYFIWAP